MKYIKCILLLLMLCSGVVRAQESPNDKSGLKTRGRVVDEQGKPAPATIEVKGSRLISSTDDLGYFEIANLPARAVLLISGVSFETIELPVRGRSDLGEIRVQPKFAEGGEVVVEANTGYQRGRPNELNGSIVVVDNKTLNQQVGTNVLKRLDGVTSGLAFTRKLANNNPQSDLNISIRGLSTINGPLNPLVVVDDFVYQGDLNSLNPNDVESITILKDAAATSIYGARGGNGVIVITTKKGKLNQPMKVELNSTVILAEKPDLFRVPRISTADYIDVEQYLYRNKFYENDIIYDWFFKRPFSPALQVFVDRRNGLISAEDSARKIDALKQLDIRNDYEKYLYRQSLTQQYSLGLRGGSAKNSYSFSVNHDRNIGSLDQRANKLNIQMQNVYRPVKSLQISLGAFYTSSKAVSGKPSDVTLNGKPVPYLRLVDDDGNPAAIPQYHPNYTDTAGMGLLLDWNRYPLEDYKHERLITRMDNILTQAGLNLKIFRGLDLDLKYQYQLQQQMDERYSDPQSFTARNTINTFSRVDYQSGTVTYIVPNAGIMQRNNGILRTQNFRSQLNFARQWGDHWLSAIAGFEAGEIRNSLFQFMYYGYQKDPLASRQIDHANQYPTLPGGGLSSIGGAPYEGQTNARFVAAYANASYSFRNRYSISGSMRKDGANILGASTNDRWKPLWSAGLGWEISREQFYRSKLFAYLKFRMSYGYSGNVDITRSALPTAGYATHPRTNLVYTQIGSINNPGLKWEESRQINYALDFRLKNDILSGNIEYYTKKGSQLYGPAYYDYTAWGYLNQITKNVAGMAGKGIDVNLTSRNLNRQVKWTTQLLFNYNENKVTEYYATTAQTGTDLFSGGSTITPVIGKPLHAIAAYRWGGLDEKGDPQGYLNGEKTTNYTALLSEIYAKGIKDNPSIIYVGRATPLFFGSLINTFTWKGLMVSVNFSYKLNYYFKRASLLYSGLYNYGQGIDYDRRWQKPGDENYTNVPAQVYTNYPQFTYRDQFYGGAEIHVKRADHLRLQYINLGYQVKENGPRSKIGLRVYANISNLGLIWTANNERLDPEAPYSIPTPKSYAIGLQASF